MPKSQTVSFENANGATLAGRLEYPLGGTRGWAIFAHCFTCSKDSLAAVRVAQELANEGIGVLRLDFTGLGQSGGAFEETSLTSNLGDIIAATEWLAEHHAPPALLIGHSLGGAAVLAVAGKLDHVKGVATIGAPADPSHVQHLFAGALDQIKRDGVAEISIGGRPIRIGQQFVDDLKTHNAPKNIAELKTDLLVMHSPVDTIVGIDNAAMIYAVAKHPKSFVSLDQADHLLARREDSRFAARVISAWAGRCIGEVDILPADKDKKDVLVVQSSADGILAHDIVSGEHRLRADEPETIPGGLNSGPTPYELLRAGLGACTAMTVRMVANRKKWPLESCRVEITHEKDKETGRDVFHRHLFLEGGLDDDQRQELLRIANKCPVHRTLENGSDVKTVLGD